VLVNTQVVWCVTPCRLYIRTNISKEGATSGLIVFLVVVAVVVVVVVVVVVAVLVVVVVIK